MIHRYIIEATDEVKGFEEAIERLDREWGIEELEPCEYSISRQAVQDYIAKYLSQYLYNDVREAVEVIDEYIGELPSVNPQSKTGYWIGIDEEPHEDYECSCCGYVVSTFTANIEPHTEYKYCPHCGAKMESEEIRHE